LELEGLTAGEAFVGELIPNVAEEVLALGFGVEKLLILFGGEGKVTIDFSAVEAQVKLPPRRVIGRSGQKLRFQRRPVHFQVCPIPDRAHDSKIVGTISLRWLGPHAASVAVGLAGNRFHGSNSAIRWMG
jgi:hypothetical protein